MTDPTPVPDPMSPVPLYGIDLYLDLTPSDRARLDELVVTNGYVHVAGLALPSGRVLNRFQLTRTVQVRSAADVSY